MNHYILLYRKSSFIVKIEENKVVDVRTGETKAVAFAEGVIDTEATLRGAMEVINQQVDELSFQRGKLFTYPKYYIFALISKVPGGPQIENCYWAFNSHPKIWVIGRSFDLNGKGRNLRNVVAIKDPYANEIPEPPYVTPSKLLVAYL